MDFAKKQLEKYGWKDGEGLGRSKQGISAPIKPKYKRSKHGLGHNVGDELNDHWWNTLYNKACGNIQIVNSCAGVVSDVNVFDEMSNKSYKSSFIRREILGNGGSKLVTIQHEDVVMDAGAGLVEHISDEQLFAACGGRTAHKGARHGLQLKGKLSRIEQQDAVLLNSTKYQNYSAHSRKLINNTVELKHKMNDNGFMKQHREDNPSIDHDEKPRVMAYDCEPHHRVNAVKKKKKRNMKDSVGKSNHIGYITEDQKSNGDMDSNHGTITQRKRNNRLENKMIKSNDNVYGNTDNKLFDKDSLKAQVNIMKQRHKRGMRSESNQSNDNNTDLIVDCDNVRKRKPKVKKKHQTNAVSGDKIIEDRDLMVVEYNGDSNHHKSPEKIRSKKKNYQIMIDSSHGDEINIDDVDTETMLNDYDSNHHIGLEKVAKKKKKKTSN